MTDHHPPSRSQMRGLVTTKFSSVPDSRRPARLANLLWRLSEILPPGATLDDWIVLLDIAPSMFSLEDDLRDGHDGEREGDGQEDIENLAFLAKRHPTKAFTLITDLIWCHTKLRGCGVPWRTSITVNVPADDG